MPWRSLQTDGQETTEPSRPPTAPEGTEHGCLPGSTALRGPASSTGLQTVTRPGTPAPRGSVGMVRRKWEPREGLPVCSKLARPENSFLRPQTQGPWLRRGQGVDANLCTALGCSHTCSPRILQSFLGSLDRLG